MFLCEIVVSRRIELCKNEALTDMSYKNVVTMPTCDFDIGALAMRMRI